MQTTDIDIRKAEAGMEKSKNTIQDAQTFIQELANRNITDIDDSRLTISKDDATYIFTIDGKNLFCVQNETNLKRFLQEFYDQKKQEETKDNEEEMTEHTTLIRINGLRIEKITSETKDELEKLKPQILNNKESYEEANDIDVIKDKTKNLINFFEKELSLAQQRKTEGSLFHPSYDRAGRAQRKLQETAIQERLTGLRALQQELNTTGKKYTSEDFNTQDAKITLTRFNDKLEELGAEVPDFILQRNDIILREGNSTFYYDFNLNNVAEARTIKNQLTKIKFNLQRIDTQAYKIVGRELFIRDLERFQEYLQDIENQPDNKDLQKPFVPENKGFYNYLIQIDPTLKAYFPKQLKTAKNTTDAGTGSTPKEELKQATPGATNEGQTTNTTNKPATPGGGFTSYTEAFEKGGIYGTVDYLTKDLQGQDPRTQNFYKSMGNLALVGGGLFLGWKVLRNAFRLLGGDKAKIKENNSRAWVLGGAGGLLLTGGRPGEFFKGGEITKNIGKLFGSWFGTPSSSVETEAYGKGFPGISALFGTKTYGEISQLTEKTADGKIKLKTSAYEQYMKESQTGTGNSVVSDFLKYIGPKDENGLLDLALTSMGISYEDLSNPANTKTNFKEVAGESIGRVASVYDYMKAKNLNHINKESMGKIKEYIANGKPSLEELDARGDVFESTLNNLDAQTQQNIENQIKALKITDPEEEKQLRSSIYSFLNKLPANDPTKQQFTIARNRANNAIYDITTYGETTSLNPQKKAFAGMESISFDTTVEALRATNLVNRIKQITKGKVADKRKAFAYNKATGDISFDGANAWYKDFDTEIVSGGRGGNLKKISPVLEANKEAFVAYLNTINNYSVKPESTFTMPNLIPGAVANLIPGMNNEHIEANNVLSAAVKAHIDQQINRVLTYPKQKGEKESLRNALYVFAKQRPANDATKMQLTLQTHSTDSNLLEFGTYEKRVTINPITKDLTLDGMRVIHFNNQTELLRAANLTNRINSFTQTHPADTKDPFHISNDVSGDIEFNEDKSWYKDWDTEMISGGWRGNLGKISSTLEANKQEYVDYLNNLGDWKGNEVIKNVNQQIRELHFVDKTYNQRLSEGFYDFFKDLPANEGRKLNTLITLNPKNPDFVNFKSYDVTTSFNIRNRTALNRIPFGTDKEMINAVNLTNRLLSLAKKEGSSDREPFNISSLGNDVEFTGHHIFDTEMLAAGWGGSLKDISPTLESEEQKKAFIDYLNARRQKMNNLA